MGEYAKSKSTGERVKIGTCEQMYYLRADQVGLVEKVPHSLDPCDPDVATKIRFRFPFPDEDRIEPGSFDDYDRGFPVAGPFPPEEVDHHALSLSHDCGEHAALTITIPCPHSAEGKAAVIKPSYRGNWRGAIEIHSQKLIGGKLCLVLRCAACKCLWRLEELAEVQPILDALNKPERDPKVEALHKEIARRIVAGYTEPNYWTKQAQPVLA